MLSKLPRFTHLDLVNFPKKLEALLADHLIQIDKLLTQPCFNWDNLIYPLEQMEDEIEQLWAPVSHLQAVVNSQELRACYENCLPLLSAYEAKLGQNTTLYHAILSLDTHALNMTQQKIISDLLLEFKLSGVALSGDNKQRFEAIQTQLSQLSNQFDNNVMDATQAFDILVVDKQKLSGLPEYARANAKEKALKRNLKGWLFNLDYPSFHAVVTYADNRDLRKKMYDAYVTRASDQGPNAHTFDNSKVIEQILALRQEKARLLDFNCYAELSLATKMANSVNQVEQFILDLIDKARSQAQAEINALKDFACQTCGLCELHPWDMAYVAEKMQQATFDISEEVLRPFFPVATVVTGLFDIIKQLYGMELKQITPPDVWHADVECYQISDNSQQIRGFIYMDLYARENKKGGAWMDSQRTRRRLLDGSIQLPVATLTCNFAQPIPGRLATLSHQEVLTLFHEMGHSLHHVLTKVDYLSASGINGVEWDAVELPSQFFEHWCWDKIALTQLSNHIDTNQLLPDDLFDKLLATKNFNTAIAMLRQLEFSLFDWWIHKDYNTAIATTLAKVRELTALLAPVDYNRFQHSFSHIFAGGYAAGYYSYKWAEVLSCDAFERFKKEGIFNAKTGQDFLTCILEVGGSKPAALAYQAFRGRPAKIDALLEDNGIVSSR